MKKNLVITVALLVSILFFGACSFAVVDGPYTYELNADGDAIITAYNQYVDPSYPDLTIPDAFPIGATTGAATVVGIGKDAFDAHHLDSVVLPSNLKYIDDGGLQRNDFTTIIIPDSVERIGKSAFWHCDITSVDLPDSLTVIEYNAFGDNALTAITLPSQLEELGGRSFNNNVIETVVIPEGITEINDYAFADNQLTSIVLPSNLVKIGTAAFQNNQLTEVTIPDKVTYIGQWSFRNNQLHTLNLEGPVEDILYESFMDNDITSLDLSKGAVNIYASSFENNAITSLVLPDKFSSVGDRAFFNNQLGSVDLPSDRFRIGNDAFSSNPLTEIALPTGPVPGYRLECEVYQSDWSNFLYYLNADYITDFTKMYYLEWDPRVLEGPVTINNMHQYGDVLSVDVSNVSNDTYTVPFKPTGTIIEVPNKGNFTYKWYREFDEIVGATSSSYQIATEDIGHKLKCRVGSDIEPGFLTTDQTETITKGDYPSESVATPVVAINSYYNIDLTPVAGYEYLLVSHNNDISTGIWQDSPEFTGLNDNTSYDIYQRLKENDSYFTSASKMLAVSTPKKKRKSSSKSYNTPSTSTSSPSVVEEKEPTKEAVVHISSEVQASSEGQSISKAIVTDAMVVQELKSIKESGNLVIQTDDPTNDIEVGISLNAIDQLKKKNVSIEIKNKIGSYSLPTEGIENKITKLFGSGINTSKVQLKLKISEAEQKIVTLAEERVKTEGGRLLTRPVAFELIVSYNEQSIEIEEMGRFVTRMIPIPEDVDISKIATGVIIESDGTIRPVPTSIVEADGRKYAALNSVTNSLYTLIEHDVICKKINGHWAENEMLVAINGFIIPEELIDVYNPDDEINRADFIKLLAKTLGLKKVEGDQFRDIDFVTNKGYIYAAYNYGLVNGTSLETFSPSESLTREQAVTILYNVLKMTDFESKPTDDKLLAFEDNNLVAAYAMKPMEWAVSENLISGKSATIIAPTDKLTCAEGIVMISRLLKILGLR